MADLTCGQGGSTGAEIVGRINENTLAGTDNLALIDALTLRVAELEMPDPRASLRLSTIVSGFQITDDATPVVMPCFDTVVIEQGGFDGFIDSGVSGSITNSTGFEIPALVAIGLNVDFPANETLEVYLYVDGVQYSTLPMIIQGNGNGKPVGLYWESEILLDIGAVLDIRGRNGDAGNYDIEFLRSTLRVDADWSERVIP